MSEKSHVSLEQRVCPVCGNPHDVGVLIHKRLRPVLDRTTVTGWEMCPEHQELYDRGFIALVGTDPEKSKFAGSMISGKTMTQENAHRTGRIAHLKAEVFEQIFKSALPMRDGEPLPMVFVEDEVITKLEQMRDA